MPICPDNSTECLLRALLEDNSTRALLQELLEATSKFNWDPLNFAITAAIGVLALIVACLTIFQGLLAAGPGRIKASKVAIGPFADLSKSRFDFTELGLRTKASVPSINRINKLHRIEREFPDHVCCSKHNPAVGTSEPGASWLRLLNELGISDPRIWSTVIRQTDNLPADISAAPAAGSVVFLAHLAAISDDGCAVERRPGSRFVTVVGKSSQLTFRDHPVLGSVAMYETYRDSPKYRDRKRPNASKYRLNLGELHSIGFVETATMLDLSHGLLKCRYLGYAVNEGSVQLSYGVFLQKLTSHCDHKHLNSNTDSVLYATRGSYGARFAKAYIFTVLLFTSVPSLVRAFPSTLLGLQGAVEQLAAQVEEWYQTPDEVTSGMQCAVEQYSGAFLPVSTAAYPFYIYGARARHHSSSSWLEDPPGAGWCTASMTTDFRKTEHDLLFASDMIQLCCDWVKELRSKGRTLKELLMEDAIKTKEKLLTGIYLVDDWIRLHNRADSICIAVSLVRDIEKELGIESPDDLESAQTITSATPKRESNHMGAQTDPERLRRILVYRAILLGALLELSADTSCLVDRSFPDSIVKVL
ncbi:uncharacterized protein A1O9_12800 [Exophiala aquamarina CBS 119918]|uniref:Uncharacterized protein n=1 Tax=Exophiala aquamarina CBS 119918 TaxID=1182545 RepID=A0A072NU86_9EURO|nr:uncharacterized protein A1O9_12800 [Exophiala aquamarina CBS 119918]KEF51186.1 hypothetical protein A1O9_12800 [Exophiala aquamarina CBS 119918]